MTGDKFFGTGPRQVDRGVLTHSCALYRDESFRNRPAIEIEADAATSTR